MAKDEDFKLLKIQTCVLRVNIHCDGCKQKVKKLLQRIEGVYQVNMDAEQQKVTVLGSVDSSTLIKKLDRARKHAEIWSQKANQNQKQKANCIKDDKSNNGQKEGLIKGLEALKNQQKFPFNVEEDEDYLEDDEEDYDEEDEMRFLSQKAKQINLLGQQVAAMQGNNAQKGFGMATAAATASKNGKMNNNAGNGSAVKNGDHPSNQNMVMKPNPTAIDQKTMQALKMNNAQFGGGANANPGEVKMGNDINSMMDLAGFHGNGANNYASLLGGNSGNNGSGGGVYHQLQPNGFMGSSSAGFPNGAIATGHNPSSMMMNMNSGYHLQQQYSHPYQSMLMNMQNRHAMQQPQMMYNRSPFIPPSTGYCYTYGAPVPPHAYMSTDSCYNNPKAGDHSATTDLFSDENTSSSCSIM